jgi:hypothetical protein
MKESALYELKVNITGNIDNYINKDNSWVSSYSNEPILLPSNITVPEFSLDMSSPNPETADCENIRILYTALKGISESQACDERLWAGLSHGICYDYVQYRQKNNVANNPETNIKTHFFFNHEQKKTPEVDSEVDLEQDEEQKEGHRSHGHGRKRSMIINCLSRLYWIGKTIYDENADDPFRVLDGLKNDFATKTLILFSNSYTNNPVVARAYLSAIMYLEKTYDKPVKREQYKELSKYLNRLGGVTVLDYFTEKELFDKLVAHFCELYR